MFTPMTQPAEGLTIPASSKEQYRSLFDPLTGLPGWALLLDRTRVALARAARAQRYIAVLVIHNVAWPPGRDEDLKALAAHFSKCVRPDDTVARVGERTFVVVCSNVRDNGEVARIAQRMVQDAGIACHLAKVLATFEADAEAIIERALHEATSLTPHA
jgi:GGDEF domain-containing protein